MSWRHILARKDLETLLAEAAGEHRLHRVLGPVALTALGIGCIIGAGIFVMTGRAAAVDAGPAVVISFAIAGLGCALAALCYAEFAAMAPVAGSAYTYAYTTLGEIFAWIIGWDLILEYSMGCSVVASAWTHYFNQLLDALGAVLGWPWLHALPHQISQDPFTVVEGTRGILNLPSVLIMLLVTVVLVLGIRESARANATLVISKLAVVVFVVLVGWAYVDRANWTGIPVSHRVLPQEKAVPGLVKSYLHGVGQVSADRAKDLERQVRAKYRLEWERRELDRLQGDGKIAATKAQDQLAELESNLADRLPKTAEDRAIVEQLLPQVETSGRQEAAASWGLLGALGVTHWLVPVDEVTRTPFTPYGLSGIMLGAAIVFFAFIGFDSISTHAEEARRPQRDVPIGILTSLVLCTALYILVAVVITGMVPYPEIDVEAPIAAAFGERAVAQQSTMLYLATILIALGGLAGMTSVLLVLFLSQARVFMAMARDGLLPGVFGRVHPRFRTPHIATMVTGGAIAVVAAFTPILDLEKMVNIGTLLAFIMVCAAVWILRVQRPEARRPFRCPLIQVVAPAGILVNLAMMLFLPVDTWLRLVIWLGIGLAIYFFYSRRHSLLTRHLLHEVQKPRDEKTGTRLDPEEAGG